MSIESCFLTTPLGDARTKGEGVKRLASALVGGTFGSASKITGSLENMVRSAAGLESALGSTGQGGLTATSYELEVDREKYTSSLSAGLHHGGDVFVNSVVTGFSGLYECPVNGYTR